MRFAELSKYFSKLENISSRLQLREILISLYEHLDFEEQQIVSYFLQGRLVPPYVSLEFNISEKTLDKYVQFTFAQVLDTQDYKELKTKHKDVAGVYEYVSSFKNNKESDLQIKDVYHKLLDITLVEGKGAVTNRLNLLDSLLKELDPVSGKYIMRLILGRLRLGVSVRSILDALSYMEHAKNGGDIKQIKKIFDRAYGLTSDIGYIVAMYLKEGVVAVKNVTFTPGIPIALQLAEREKTLEAALRRIPYPFVDPKLDGLRGQIHIFTQSLLSDQLFKDRVWFKAYKRQFEKNNQSGLLATNKQQEVYVKIFSRNLEDLTQMFPEIHDFVEKNINYILGVFKDFKVPAIVLDSELVGYNESIEEFYGFQVTMKRRRKYDINKAKAQVPIKAFVFDLLFFGKEVLDIKLKDRRKLLTKFFNNPKLRSGAIVLNKVRLFTNKDGDFSEVMRKVEEMFYKYIAMGVEGIMIKDPDSYYEPGVRKFNWIKFKRAMKKELADTLDVVILGYYYGKGRLASLGIGGLLAGVYDKEHDTFVTITKIGTGLTDKDWQIIKAKLDELRVQKKPFNVKVAKELEPDVWVYPELVIEVEADEITKSPIHTAGVALRFPRFKRIRKDKSATDATTLQEVLEMIGMEKGGN